MAYDNAPTGIQREEPATTDSRAVLVASVTKGVIEAKKHWKEKAFDRMRQDMRFVAGEQWDTDEQNKENYVANIVQRHVNQSVASLYAKNPTVVAKRKKRREFKLWDEQPGSMMSALQTLGMAPPPMAGPGAPPGPGQPPQPAPSSAGPAPAPGQQQVMPPPDPVAAMQAMALLQDIQQGYQRKKMIDTIGETLEIVWQYFVDEQKPPFKQRLKKMVKRTKVCGVGYIKLGFQREMGRDPHQERTLADMSERLARIEQLALDVKDGEADDASAEAEELRLAMAALQQEPEIILREGLTFDFPLSTRIIPDLKCQQLAGFVGCDRVAEEYVLSRDQVKQIFGVDLGTQYMGYTKGGDGLYAARDKGDAQEQDMACVWEVYDRPSGLVYCVADGYKDFLREPASPQIELERFWPIYAITFNEMENETHVFPQSDVRLLRSAQKEYNRSKEAIRQHRIAAKPKWAAPAGALPKEDQRNLSTLPPHHVMELQGLKDGQPITNLLQPIPAAPVDPNLYETEGVFNDVLRIAGTQEANLGPTSGSTATESSIAESSRMSSTASNVDDLDDMLTELARDGSGVLLLEMSPDKVTEIVGPGAVWPSLTAKEIAKELYLEVEAGSSGRPNKAQDLANFERIAPYLMQTPNLNPMSIASYIVRLTDDKIDQSQFVLEGMPSITALNGMAQPSTGDPLSDPNAQGGQGGDNAAKPPGQAPGAQPAYPAPSDNSGVTVYDKSGKRTASAKPQVTRYGPTGQRMAS